MHGLYLDAWLEYALAFAQHLKKAQRVLATRQPDEYAVAVGEHVVVGECFLKAFV